MKKAKVSDESVEEVRAALIAFFERQGDGDANKGYKAVAKETGINAQQLYYIISDRNDPTLKTVMAILRHYPGEEQLRRALSLPVGTLSISKESVQSIEERVRAEVQMNREMVEHLKRENERLWRLALPESVRDEMSFIAASSFTTASAERIGFKPRFMPTDRTALVTANWPLKCYRR